MKYIITGRNIEVTEGLKSAIYEKIGKLERYFTPDATVYVTLSVQKDRQKIEVTIPVKEAWFVQNRKVRICMFRSI